MKNAYEIRLDVLQMAHNDVYDKYHLTLDSHRDPSTGQIQPTDLVETLAPNTSEIIQRAEELYKFVEKQ